MEQVLQRLQNLTDRGWPVDIRIKPSQVQPMMGRSPAIEVHLAVSTGAATVQGVGGSATGLIIEALEEAIIDAASNADKLTAGFPFAHGV